MSEKRMLTRNRGEPPLKKRALTPTPPPPPRSTPSKPPKAPEPTEIREAGLPTKLTEGRPLPTLPEPQDINLSSKAFQSLSESGVLATSIERSKQRWINDGVFERYWIRPVKKATPNPSNPPKETMQKLGGCSMIIEPHVFEVTLYTVKDLPTAPLTYSNQPPPPSHYSPFPQHPSYSTPLYNGPFTGTTDSPSQNSMPPFNRFGPYAPPPPPPAYHNSPQPTMQTGPSGPLQMRPANTGNQSSPTDTPQSDPVIQILAQRAASDHILKNLMKVVASGQASPDQLKEFQNHIDEINSSLKNRQGSQSQKGGNGEGPKAPTPDDPLPSVEGHNSPHAPPPARPATSTAHSPTQAAPPPPQFPIKAEPLPQIYPPAPPLQHLPKPKPTPMKPDVHSVVFEFSTTSDRFLLPRFSIIEYLPGNSQVVVSFLVIRRGSTVPGPNNYDKTKSYYQPVTLQLSCPNSRILEPIAKVVAPHDEVRRYMDDIFDKMQPAENVFLATRLPRTKDGEGVDDEEAVDKGREELVRATYEAPNSIIPLGA